MKLKPYMRGMGIGIILTTLILTIGNPKIKLTDQEVITRAKELGMVEGVDNNSNLEQVLGSVNPTGGAAEDSITPEPESSAQPTASLTQAPTIAPTQAPTPVPTVDPAKPTIKPTDIPVPTNISVADTNNGNDNEITFTIKSGMSSRMVSELLVSVGLIDDSMDFNKYIENKKKASIIRVGTYIMPKGSTYEEIVRKITTK